ncbi:trypsin-like peptidase domain-containing protein [Luteolibacter sp. LG18]|uniref:trypsin-like peptidase domain-containing protein n=1 Tax=Luteolibacter sp. LG18 TaxID=2819286 RepID=UPI002B2D62FB|nr:hypothetical protein llg_40100 [Luteolibacter sp. LG18]
MSQRFTTELPLAGILGVSLLLSACEKTPKSVTAELKRLREENAALQADLTALKKSAQAEKDGLAAENQALKAGTAQLGPLGERAEKAERENDALRAQLTTEGKAAFAERLRALASVREKAIGETIASLDCPGGRSYQNVVIRSINDTSVNIRHDSGTATLHVGSAPDAWVKRFGLVPEEVPAAPAAAAPDTAVASATPAPATPAATPTPVTDPFSGFAQPSTASVPAEIANVANRVMPAVVIIKGDKSEGSGFFAREGDNVYLYTAAHVLSGNTKLEVRTSDGKVHNKFGTFELAEKGDLARLAMADVVPASVPLLGNGSCVIGDSVFAIGNSGGGGVLTVLPGSVKALGPGEVELDAAVIQGNSGGPVFTADGKALGVVTHLLAARKDIWAAETPFSEVRRFAARLDANIRWRRMPIGTFLAEPRQIDEINRCTRLLFALSYLTPTTRGMRTDRQLPGGANALAILQECQDMAAVKDLLDMNNRLAANSLKQSDSDLLKKYAGYYGSILAGAKRQSANFNPANFVGFHHDPAVQAATWRTAAEQEVSELLGKLNSR